MLEVESFGVFEYVRLLILARPVIVFYQFSVPPVHPEALNVTVPVPHREPSTPVGAEGMVVTVPTTSVLGPSQPKAFVQVTQ